MGAVFLKAFKARWRNLLSIIAVTAIAICAGIMFTKNNISVAYPNIDSMIAATSVFAAVIIPLISCFSLNLERRNADEYLSTLPISSAQTVLGTFLADVAFVAVPTAIMAIYPIILGFYGKTSYSYAYSALAVLLLFEIFCVSLATMFSSLFRHWWVSLVATYAVIVSLFLLGAFASLFPAPLGEICEFISPFREFDPILYGKFNVPSAVFYVLFSALFVLVAIKYFKREKTADGKFKNFKISVSCIVLALSAVAISVSTTFLPSTMRWADVSANKIYRINASTKQMISTIDEDVTIYFIDTDQSEEKLISFVERYCDSSPRLTLKMVDTSKDTSFKSKYGFADNADVRFCMVVESAKRNTLIGADELFKWYNSDYSELGYMSATKLKNTIGSLSSMLDEYSQYYSSMSTSDKQKFSEYMAMCESLYMYSTRYLDAETVLNRAIDYVTTDVIPTFYFVTGHGEKNTQGGPLDITKLDKIPVEASMLMINTPDTDYTESEVEMLIDYMENGGRLVIFTAESNYSMPNLMKLLKAGGLSLEDEPIADGEDNICTATVNTTAAALSMLNTGEKVTLEMRGASSILTDDSDKSLKFVPLFSFDTEVKVEVDDGNGSTKEETKVKTQNLGMSVTKNDEPMLVWITGSDTFNVEQNSLGEEEYKNYATAMYGLSSIIYWTGKNFVSEVEELTPVAYDVAELLSIKEGGTAFVGTVVIGILPLVLLGVGLVVSFTRKKRSAADPEN